MTTTDDYAEWLYHVVGLPTRGRNRSYHKLFDTLYAKEFVWLMLEDESRAEDGKELRWEFANAAGLAKVAASWMYQPCSILEMMVGLARKISTLTEVPIRTWFEELLRNLGVDIYTDLSFDHAVVEEKIECLNWRTYSTDGSGGLFPLRNPANNQRKVDLWYQMNAWLLEKNAMR